MTTLRLNSLEREQVFKDAESMLGDIVGEHLLEAMSGGTCVFWAWAITEILQKKGLPATFQAGSASWPRLSREMDDGKMTTFTHYSYVWNRTLAVRSVMFGQLPELHAWCVVGDSRDKDPEIIDATSGDQPRLCREFTGSDWPGPKPPDRLWCLVSELPNGTVYKADKSASRVAASFMYHFLYGGPLTVTI